MIILTVPHSITESGKRCFGSGKQDPKHTCDYAALESAYRMGSVFEQHNIPYIILEGDQNRYKGIDLNRRVARNTSYRKFLRNFIKRFKVDLVIDVHSYPPNYLWGENKTDVDAVILYDFYSGRKLDMLMLDKLSRTIKIQVFQGSENDIQDEMNELGIPSFLLEFSERTNVRPHLPEQIATFLAKSIK